MLQNITFRRSVVEAFVVLAGSGIGLVVGSVVGMLIGDTGDHPGAGFMMVINIGACGIVGAVAGAFVRIPRRQSR
jgi:uncharacterized membrane protein YgaE (UPF0421/DUF939 family)